MEIRTRRSFLAQTLGGAWTGASLLEQAIFRAARARAQAPTAPAGLFDIIKVADGVYAAIARAAALINCNAAIFENSRDLLIVDAHSKPSAVAPLTAQIAKDIGPKPVRYVVNTHFHWDHIQGAPEYRKIAPGATILASTATRNLIAEFAAARLKASLEELPKSLEMYQAKLAAAKTSAEKVHFQRMIAETRAYLAEMRTWTPELPSVTFQQDLVLHDRAQELHLAFRGRGHTAGDIVVHCPQKKVIATGDLLHGFLPNIGDGYPREWPRTLRAIAEFDFEQVIGGHGDVQRSRERLRQMAGYIEELTAAVEEGKRQGLGLAQLRQSITPATLKSLNRNGYGEFVTGSLRRFNASAALDSPAEILARGVSENVAATFQALERT